MAALGGPAQRAAVRADARHDSRVSGHDVFHVSPEDCISFLSPLIESWDIDLETFSIEIVLNRNLALGHLKRFDFVEREPPRPFAVESGLEEFLRDPILSGDATDEEIEFLKSLYFKDKRPLPLYYYRVLQNTRDPFHFRISAEPNRPDPQAPPGFRPHG